MNRLFAPVCLLIFLFAAPICLAQTSTAPNSKIDGNKWEEFTLPNGQFVVSMPGKPTSQTIPLNSNGETFVAHILGFDKEDESYAVGYLEFPNRVDDSTKAKSFFDQLADKEVSKVGGKLISQTDIEITGYRGREVTMEVADGFWVDRFYLVGRRIYFISAFAAKTSSAAKEITTEQNALIRKYLESFKLKLEPH